MNFFWGLQVKAAALDFSGTKKKEQNLPLIRRERKKKSTNKSPAQVESCFTDN